jgi:hypothetical protein
VAIGDIDGDGDLDAVFAAAYGGANTVWRNDDGLFSQLPIDIGSSIGAAVAIGDLNADETHDIVFSSSFESTGHIWLNRDAASLGDFDEDGYVDELDYQVWCTQYGQAGSGLSSDANKDGRVDVRDYTVWRDHVGLAIGASKQGTARVSTSQRSNAPPERPAPSASVAIKRDDALPEAPDALPEAPFESYTSPAQRAAWTRAVDTVFAKPALTKTTRGELLLVSQETKLSDRANRRDRMTVSGRVEESTDRRSVDEALSILTWDWRNTSRWLRS